MLFHDLTLLVWIAFVLLLLQLVALPLIFFVASKFTFLKDAAWGFGRIFSLLLLSLLVWNLAFLKVPINTHLGVGILFFILSLFSLYVSWAFFLSKKKFLQKFLQKFGRIILIEEIIFFLALVFLFVARSFQPEILGLEKFMDAGFIQAYLKSPTLPAFDIWYAGSSINYYSFGQFYHSILVQLWQIDLSYAYNLLLAALFALLCVQLFSLAFNLRFNLGKSSFKAAVFAGVFAVFLVALGANGHTLWYFFSKGSFAGYWYPDATRFIERTIHEFPAYSFVVSDLHAHVLSLPISLLLLLLVFIWLREVLALPIKNLRKIKLLWRANFFYLASLMGILFGVLVMTNTWDILIYGALLFLIGIFLLFKNKFFFGPLVLSAMSVLIGTALFSAFWLLNFTPISNSLMLAQEHTPFWQLLVLWGPHLFWATLLLFVIKPFFSIKKIEQAAPILIASLFILVIFLIIFPEFFYFKDIYTTYPRANTMFKLVFQGFMLLGVLVGLFFSFILFEKSQQKNFFAWRLFDLRSTLAFKKKKIFLLKVRLRQFFLLHLPISLFLFFSTLVYPYLAYKNYYGNFKNYQGLNGLAWFERKYPDDYVLLNYLKNNESEQVNIVEAVGESYTEFARISAFSGMSTILGWRVHEWLWRASWDGPAKRTGVVEKIYNNPTSPEAKSYLSNYQIKYIVVGSKEYEAYKLMDLEGLVSLGPVVAVSGKSYLIKLF